MSMPTSVSSSVIVEIRAAEGGEDAKSLSEARAAERRGQVGSGMRGDKRRTVRAQDGTVVDHVTGRRWELRGYLKGQW